jgi:hypothetical protein
VIKTENIVFSQKTISSQINHSPAFTNHSSAWDEADAAYKLSLSIARIACRKNKKAQRALALSGDREDTLSGWIKQTSLFYTNLLADASLLSEMAKSKYTKAKLTAEQKLAKKVMQLNAKQEKEKGEAQSATVKRDRKVKQLDEWMYDFREVAKVARSGKDQWLEMLVIKEEA